jgi:hypothetical protein
LSCQVVALLHCGHLICVFSIEKSSVPTNYHDGNQQGNRAELNKTDKEAGFQIKLLHCLLIVT